MYHQEARFYQLIKQRGHLSQEDETDYLRLLTGLEGEARLAQVIQDLGLSTFYLTDLWIPLGKGTQIDGLLLVPQGLYLVEIKHYGGHFLYQGFASRLNGRPYQHDLLGQVARAQSLLQQFLRSQQLDCQLVSKLIFSQDHLQVEGLAAGQYMLWPQALAWLQGLSDQMVGQPCSRRQQLVLDLLGPLQHASPYRPRQLTSIERQTLLSGIGCPRCLRLGMTYSRYKVSCPHCGFREDKAAACLRSACEWALLNHDLPLSRSAISNYVGSKQLDRTLQRQLAKYFHPLHKGHHACYQNDYATVYQCLSQYDGV